MTKNYLKNKDNTILDSKTSIFDKIPAQSIAQDDCDQGTFGDAYSFCGSLISTESIEIVVNHKPKTQQPSNSPQVNNIPKSSKNLNLQKPQNNDNNR
ncbi:hypothetical protein N9O56_01970 [Rickettsiales bacterium]|nr:hypothetical protein [Rickettsiales bacterium]